MASIPISSCRRPRRARESGTAANASTNDDVLAASPPATSAARATARWVGRSAGNATRAGSGGWSMTAQAGEDAIAGTGSHGRGRFQRPHPPTRPPVPALTPRSEPHQRCSPTVDTTLPTPWVAGVTSYSRSSWWRRVRQVGRPGADLRDADEQQGRPAPLHVAADAFLAVVAGRPEGQGALHLAPAAFDGGEILVDRGPAPPTGVRSSVRCSQFDSAEVGTVRRPRRWSPQRLGVGVPVVHLQNFGSGNTARR